MMVDQIAARWSMREAKRSWIYGVIAVAGVVLGAGSLALSRQRPNLRGRPSTPGADTPPADGEESVERPARNESRLGDDLAAAGTDRHAEAMLASSPGLPMTQADELLPDPVAVRPPRKNEEPGSDAGMLHAGTGTLRVLEFSSVPSPGAEGNFVQRWIQTGCTVLLLVLVLFFGITLSRSLTALIAAQRDSQSAALASQQLFRTGQRAWVGMIDAVPLPLRSDGGGFTLRMKNSGMTPAFDVQFSAVITLAGSEALTEAEWPVAATPLGTLLPGAAYATDVLFRTSPEAVGALGKHQQRAVGWLRMTYTDVFKTPHSSRSCFYWYPDLKSVTPCEAFNETK